LRVSLTKLLGSVRDPKRFITIPGNATHQIGAGCG
jgi:hypothetical protein